MTLLLLLAVLAADPAPPSADPKPVPATRAEEKELLEWHKQARPRLPMPPADPAGRGVNNARFRQFYLPWSVGGTAGGREPDPAMTLDPTFKVKLFWVTSRANNCLYCLGHQEHKLAAAGVADDDIAALDGDWAGFAPAERAALAFTRKLTVAPHTVTPADLDDLKRHYTPTQVLEILVTVAGFNSTNRWTDGLNIPAEADASFFRKPEVTADLSTFQTPTSARFATLGSKVAPLGTPGATAQCRPTPAAETRPPLEDRAAVEAALADARTRTAVLPLAAGDGPNWVRLLGVFPKAGKGRIDAHNSAAEKGELPARLKALVAWVAARTDRSWYAVGVARERMRAAGFADDQLLDPEFVRKLPAADQAVAAFAFKLTAAPGSVTDADVAGLRARFPDPQVAEIVHQVCTAVFFDRVTEAARLPLDK